MKRVLTWCRERPWTGMVGVGLIAAALGYGAGRFAAPTRVETVDSSSWFGAWEWRQATHETTTAGPVTTTTTTRKAPGRPAQPPVPGPAGTPICPECPEIEETSTTTQSGPVVTHRDTEGSGSQVETRTEEHRSLVERDPPRVAIFGTVAVPFSGAGAAPPAYGVTVTARVLGPVTVLAGGEGNAVGGSARVGVGVTF